MSIENSFVEASKIGASVTIKNGSLLQLHRYSNGEARLEIGDFSVIDGGRVTNSILLNSNVVRDSVVGSSVLSDGARVLDDSSVSLSTLGSGVRVRQSSISEVSIYSNKQNNWCVPSNVDKPAVTVDEDGNETLNPCYNPIYNRGE